MLSQYVYDLVMGIFWENQPAGFSRVESYSSKFRMLAKWRKPETFDLLPFMGICFFGFNAYPFVGYFVFWIDSF